MTHDPSAERRWADRLDGVGATLVALALALAPLAFDRETAEVFAVAKLTLLRGLIAVATALWLAALGLRRELAVRAPGFVVAILLWLGWAAVTTATSVSAATSLVGEPGSRRGFVTLAHLGLLALLSLHHGRDARRARSLAMAILFAAVIAGGHAGLQHVGADPLSWPTANPFFGRSAASVGDPVALGALLATALPLGIAGALAAGTTRRRRVAFAAATLVIVAALAFATARAAIVAAVIATAVLVLALGRAHGATRGRSVLHATIAALAVGAIIFTADARVAYRFGKILDSGRVDRDRVQIWDAAAAAIGARPWLGSGPDTFAITFPRFASSGWFDSAGDDAIPSDAHALPLQIGATTGAIGLALFLAIVAQAARAGHRAEVVDRDLAIALACAVAAYLLQAMVAESALAAAIPFWAGLGLLAARSRVERVIVLKPVVAALVLAISVLPFGESWLAQRMLAADRAHGRASALARHAPTAADPGTGDAAALLAAAERALPADDDLLPREVEHWRRALADGAPSGDLTAALTATAAAAEASTAAGLAPRVQGYAAALAERLQDAAGATTSPTRRAQFLARAEAALRGAVSASPEDHRLHAALARLHAIAGLQGDAAKMAEAQAGLERAIELAPGVLSLHGERFALAAAIGRPERILVLAGDFTGAPASRAAVLRLAGRSLTDGALTLRGDGKAEGAKRYLELAVSAFAAARELAPRDPDAVYEHAVSLLLHGDSDGARKALAYTLDLAPSHAPALALKARQKW